MVRPNAKMKVTKKNGVTFESNVDHVKFTIEELIHAANRDVGKFITKETANAIDDAYRPYYVKGRMSLVRKNKFKKTYANKSVQYWARKRELDLQVGFKNHNWMTQQELGEYNYPRLGLLRNTVAKNIKTINDIQGQYITELNKENPSVPSGEDEGDGE
ncbi:hypothetical protein ANHYDRO_01413 [Anaerococcus hydrogenalis DSM 7454]|uniref:Phage protein, HK97 gp10 family n=1 Tax=Anaerococcus hydrogenalis DSM 7454 TaxID=561177 RepID=B6W9Y7_9FIRM|nr:hypothetical protein [Anaerococcus hydrogenalis]EEB35747.1 hypothetical protein ANHYDRO_01413 [Anaerococcus hydrogenalis DSM 7454]